MSEPEFLELDVVMFLHDRALREYGGIQGVKNEMLLFSALDRPETKLAYSDPGMLDLFDLGAAYAYGLASNHPFNDGNKRTAWSSCLLFLRSNGITVTIPTIEVVRRVVELVAGGLDEGGFADWLRESASAPRKRS